MATRKKQSLASKDSTYQNVDFGYELMLTGHLAASFYKENCERFCESSISEYVSHALGLIAGFGVGMHVTDTEKTELLKLRGAAKTVKDDLLQARTAAERTIGSTRTSKLEGGFWHYYEQVLICIGVQINIVKHEHKVTRPTVDIYDHYASISFSKDNNLWLYKVTIKDNKDILIESELNGQPIGDTNTGTPNDYVNFLLTNVARSVALNNAVEYVNFMKTEGSAAKRAKAISNLLKGDFKSKKKGKQGFESLEILG